MKGNGDRPGETDCRGAGRNKWQAKIGRCRWQARQADFEIADRRDRPSIKL